MVNKPKPISSLPRIRAYINKRKNLQARKNAQRKKNISRLKKVLSKLKKTNQYSTAPNLYKVQKRLMKEKKSAYMIGGIKNIMISIFVAILVTFSI